MAMIRWVCKEWFFGDPWERRTPERKRRSFDGEMAARKAGRWVGGKMARRKCSGRRWGKAARWVYGLVGLAYEKKNPIILDTWC